MLSTNALDEEIEGRITSWLVIGYNASYVQRCDINCLTAMLSTNCAHSEANGGSAGSRLLLDAVGQLADLRLDQRERSTARNGKSM